MAARVIPRIGLLVFVLVSSAAQGQPIPSAYERAAQAAGVPAGVLFAVALQESGTTRQRRVIPWPWSLNIAGASYRYANRALACVAVRLALRAMPATRIDIGLGQINAGYHRHRVDDVCELLDPYRNLAIAASILVEHHHAGEAWSIAIGRYHRPAGGAPAARYRRRVERHLVRVVGSNTTTTLLRSASP